MGSSKCQEVEKESREVGANAISIREPLKVIEQVNDIMKTVGPEDQRAAMCRVALRQVEAKNPSRSSTVQMKNDVGSI